MAVDSLRGYYAQAQARLTSAAWRYLQYGSGDELTLRANRRAFDRRAIVPRPLVDVRGGHTRVELFGEALAHPIVLAPIAYQRLFHPDGECASAAAASAHGSLCVVSSLASQPFGAIARAGEGRCWFQLYWQGSPDRTWRLTQRALSAGCGAVVLTVDAPIRHAALALPEGVTAVNLEPDDGVPTTAAAQSVVFQGWMARAPTWSDVAWLRERLHVPFLLKGILHPDDAARAVALGCDGVVISNHGGRVVDGAPASLDALPAARARVGERVPLVLDGGIRSGRDVFKALALGARAVLLGRPYLWGLAHAGALGVAHVLRLLRDELEMTMALAGRATLAEIGRDCVDPAWLAGDPAHAAPAGQGWSPKASDATCPLRGLV